MSKANIERLYEQRIRSRLVDQLGIPVQFDNEAFTPPNNADPRDNCYVRVFFLYGATTSPSLEGTDKQVRGVCQLTVVTPKNIGKARANEICEEIDALFPNNLLLEEGNLALQVVSPLSIPAGIPTDAAYSIPTSFTFQANW